ncbi:2-dehydropantoate 2-reductase [Rubripirellula lacrimiformis]|uniref:2-dehydropantoate 2-reductase n=1 Tax=Rubripirellula lacrimiformis TaxID=1930273 RepID=A0A517NFU6_9BACT|nr:putative 2-dehydropantoate 2-reductase [Rubripirellula lacrimiformis]QDT06007.1 2-dehydropantoate 2-reductase [Rubripirellula lacrimiformis]
MKKQRYAVIGAGALGGLYGGLLARAGFEVHFLLNRDYDHVMQHGLQIDSKLGDFHLSDVHAHASADTMPPCDVTILGLKTTNNGLLQDLLPAPTREGGLVLVLQNGLNSESDAAAVVGPENVLGGCCFLCSNKVGPGHIRHIDQGRIVFGEFGDRAIEVTPRVQRICDEMVSAGIDAHTTDDLPKTRWKKLMWNIPFNGLSVVLDASTKELVDDPDSVALVEQIIREVHAGAAACGVTVSPKSIATTIDVTRTMVPYDSSMRLDYLAKRPIEVEAILGNPIRAAQGAGFAMPHVETLYRQLKFLNQRNQNG